MDEGGASGESGSGSSAVQFGREEDPFGLDQFVDTVAAWRPAAGEIGSGSSSCSGGDAGDLNK